MCKFKKALLVIIILMLSLQSAKATDTYIPIRVGISDTSFQTYLFDYIEFNNANEINVMDNATGYSVQIPEIASKIKVTSENNLFRIYVDNTLVAKNLSGPITISPREGCYTSINNLKRKGKQALYRGIIELTRSNKDISKFSIVNVLSLKNYLRGVVPNEMPVRFGLEALKAQTIAARNYAVTPRIKAYDEFDVCDSVACQVYFGANTEDELSDKAIEETNGIIALDNEDKPILALYSSTAGGYTESYEFAFSDPETKVFPSKEIHYLNAIPDSNDFEILDTDEKAENFYTSKPEAFDDLSPYYRWSKEWNVEELSNVLAGTLIHQSKTGFVTPQLVNKTDFGTIQGINVLQRGKSGKIVKLEIVTNKNKFVIQKELVIRRCFQKNGISLPSANFVINYINAEKPIYKFYGGGFGHGVGLSQWGAGKMASIGYSFDEILQHYYKGIKLATIPISVYPNKPTNKRTFYTEQNEAQVIIKNNCNADKLKIYINDKELNVRLRDEIKTINISRYINKGENKISYEILDEDCEQNTCIEVFVMVKEANNE